MNTRKALLTLLTATVMATLSNCARVEPVTLKDGRADRPAWGDPMHPSGQSEALADKSAHTLAGYFNMF